MRLKSDSSHFRRVAELGIQAAEALHAAHEYGVVHRDIKPSNLLLDASGKLWVTDFGLARFQRDASLTQTGDVIGTMRYMSPEQAAGQSALVDHRSDIYALGVTLYELACLQPAFTEERGQALLKQIDSNGPPRPRQICREIPLDLETVILKAMAHDRDERYATAKQLAADLSCVLEGQPTQARPPTLLDRAGCWVRRRQRLVVATLAALVLCVVGLSIGTALVGRATWEAKWNAERADRMYRNARQMLDRLGMEIAEDLDDVAGAENVRQKLLIQVRTYYQGFVEESNADPRLRSAAAIAHCKIGSLLEQLGSKEESLAAHGQAASICEQLLAADPGDFHIEQQLALAENNVGLALMRLGKDLEARERFAIAARRQERLLARQPRNSNLETELALSHNNLGLLLLAADERASAEASFKRTIERLERVATNAEVDHNTMQLAAAYNNLASVYREARPLEAVRLHGKALDLLQSAAQAERGSLSVRRDVGITLNNLGTALARAGQCSAARAAHDQAIAIREELVREAPLRLSYRTDLAVSFNNLGMLESEIWNAEPAESAFRRALQVYELLLAQFPADAAIQSHIASVYSNLGVALELSGEMKPAAAAIASAIDHQQAALALVPGLSRGQALLAKHRESQSRVLGKLEVDSDTAAESVLEP